jgi:hypothetical protein
MVARIYLVINLRDIAVFIDENADTARITRLAVGTRTICDPDAAVSIAQQRKGELVLLGKRGVTLDVVEADTKDLDIILLEISDLIAEPATLDRSTRSIGLWIEPQNNLAAAQFRKRDILAFMRREREVRRPFTDLRHH